MNFSTNISGYAKLTRQESENCKESDIRKNVDYFRNNAFKEKADLIFFRKAIKQDDLDHRLDTKNREGLEACEKSSKDSAIRYWNLHLEARVRLEEFIKNRKYK